MNEQENDARTSMTGHIRAPIGGNARHAPLISGAAVTRVPER